MQYSIKYQMPSSKNLYLQIRGSINVKNTIFMAPNIEEALGKPQKTFLVAWTLRGVGVMLEKRKTWNGD